MRVVLVLAVVVAWAGAAAAAPAVNPDNIIPTGPAAYRACDGYGPPTAAADGVTQRNPALGPDGDTHRDMPKFGNPTGLAACMLALDRMKAFPQHWIRRVTLLRAEALHWLTAGNTARALQDLDAADAAAAGHADGYTRRSLVLANTMARAYVLGVAGDSGQADALAVAAWESRPFSTPAAIAALLVLGPKGEHEAIVRILTTAAPYDPNLAPFVAEGALPGYPPAGAAAAKALYDVLPEPETAARVPSSAVTGVFTGVDGEHWMGVRLSPAGEAPLTIVARGDSARQMLEDVALLKAADLTLAAGHKAFRVTGVDHTTLVSGGNGPALMLGYQAEEKVVFLDPDGANGRALDAQTVHDALAPLYPPAGAAN